MTSIIGWPGPAKWNFIEGPITLGLLPEEYRARRMEALIREMTFVSEISIPLSCTHVGFLPEDPNNPLYGVMVDCLRRLADHAGELGHVFCETGCETPITLRRAIEDASEHLGINLIPRICCFMARPIQQTQWTCSASTCEACTSRTARSDRPAQALGRKCWDREGWISRRRRKLTRWIFRPLIIEREIRGPSRSRTYAARSPCSTGGWRRWHSR